jgi:hypothetical protein
MHSRKIRRSRGVWKTDQVVLEQAHQDREAPRQLQKQVERRKRDVQEEAVRAAIPWRAARARRA